MEFIYAIGGFLLDVVLWAFVIVALLACISLIVLCTLWLWGMWLEIKEEEEDDEFSEKYSM